MDTPNAASRRLTSALRTGLTAVVAATLAALSPGTATATATATGTAGVTSAASLPAPLPGAEVYPRPSDGTYDITGGGFGHGIGMSQYGAHGAALAGLTYGEILEFYYPGTVRSLEALASLRVGITVDDDGVLTVPARSGLSVTIGGTKEALPTAPTQWRVRATGATTNTCSLDAFDGSAWSSYRSGRICPVRFSTSAGTVDVLLPGERRVYRGSLIAVWRAPSTVGTANDVSMQSYLRSVVPAEMPPSWAAQALRSQSVAARTYASRRSGATSWYDTCDTTACQVYRGLGRRNSDGTITWYEYASTDDAVQATDDVVLMFRFSDGVTRLATTMFSSSNGGYIAPGSPDHPYLTAKSDPYDDVSINARHRWTGLLPVTALESYFRIHRVDRLQVTKRDGFGSWGGRIVSVRVEGVTSTGAYTYVDATGNDLRAARPWPTYSTGLSSTYFGIAPTVTATRLAGADRYATAAAVAAARYSPGVEVVYVASGLTFPDALAGAARAAYNRAPLLLTRPTSLPTSTRDAIIRLQPARVVVLGGAVSVSEPVAASLAALTTTGDLQRVSGTDRYATAAELAGYYPSGPAVAYVASGETFPDALSGAAIAGRDRVPIVLTRAASLPGSTAEALRRLAPSRIVVVGGQAAVSDAVLAQLQSLATSGVVSRYAGGDRYATAARVAAEYSSAASVYVASGETFPDALAGAAAAGRDRVPLLLTRAGSLPAPTGDTLRRLNPTRAFVLGGTDTISENVRLAILEAMSS
ncbi:cell wall-binding repeat-containing protein [Intrasporangium sp. DVR]|uniref:cell wall-binding repeat-containing protein n=1 Tax=Intrasporangium sp. DVR TaxID=3127867 RepID=UPI00313A6EF8